MAPVVGASGQAITPLPDLTIPIFSHIGNHSHYQYHDLMKKWSSFLAIAALVASTSACRGPGSLFGAKKPSQNATFSIAASFYPIAEIVSQVGGDKVRVVNLTPAGTDAHEIELTAKQLQELQDAKITFYLGEHFQPSIKKAIDSLKGESVDLLKVTPTAGFTCGGCEGDPHVWLDPANMILMTREVVKRLSAARPVLATQFSSNADVYVKELEAVGTLIDTSFTKCASTTLVTSHYSFLYFATRANLEVSSLAPGNPDAQLSAKQIEQITKDLRTKKVTTIFSEELVASSVVSTMAKSLNARVDVLQPLEGITNSDLKAGKNYISAQRENVARIAKGLRCS
jgi:zinc transport system substrate-binding protein